MYDILKQREEVFIIEQNCIYKDIDNVDLNAFHLMLKEQGEILAYLRILKINENSNEISFGRVLVNKQERGKSYAKKIVEESITFIKNNLKEKTITIEAQVYLKEFYKTFGFVISSDEFLEDGIPHVWMKKEI